MQQSIINSSYKNKLMYIILRIKYNQVVRNHTHKASYIFRLYYDYDRVKCILILNLCRRDAF